MGRPRKTATEDLTFLDFQQYYSTKEHDWKAMNRFNESVNRCLGVDIFKVEPWPVILSIGGEEIVLNVYDKECAMGLDSFDYETLINFMEENLNDSERC